VHHFLRSRVSALVALNQACGDEAVAAGYPASRIVVIPNGVEVGPSPDPRPADRPLHVIYVGGLRSEKRVDVLLEAWKLSRVAGRLSLIGDGPERARLQARASELGIAVSFLGNREDPTPLQREADVMALPSDAEGMSNALIEAMAAGCACVATHIGGNVDCLAPGAREPSPGSVHEGPFGWLVRRGDNEALALALRRLAADREVRTRLGAAARERACSEYALPRVAAAYADLALRLLREQEGAT
jgi:glycosyltransferase involved in cell wall biosynthesis